MQTSGMNRIDRSIEIAAPPERVWRALTDAGELSAWFKVAIEGTIAAGRDIWMTSQSTDPKYAGVRFRVRIAELTPPGRVVWKWQPGMPEPGVDVSREPMTTVTFTLEATAGGTRVSVAETGFDLIAIERRAKVHEENSHGWTEVLRWLQTHAEAKA